MLSEGFLEGVSLCILEGQRGSQKGAPERVPKGGFPEGA